MTYFSADDVARRLSRNAREVLIDHVKEPQLIDRRINPLLRDKRFAIKRLTVLDLIRPWTPNGHATKSARETVLTDRGREVAAAVLAECAEVLVRAGCLDDVRGLKLTPTELQNVRLQTTSVPALTEP